MRDAEPASRIPHPALKLELASVTVYLSINFRLVIAVHHRLYMFGADTVTASRLSYVIV